MAFLIQSKNIVSHRQLEADRTSMCLLSPRQRVSGHRIEAYNLLALKEE